MNLQITTTSLVLIGMCLGFGWLFSPPSFQPGQRFKSFGRFAMTSCILPAIFFWGITPGFLKEPNDAQLLRDSFARLYDNAFPWLFVAIVVLTVGTARLAYVLGKSVMTVIGFLARFISRRVSSKNILSCGLILILLLAVSSVTRAQSLPAATGQGITMPSYTILRLQMWHDPITGQPQEGARLIGQFSPWRGSNGQIFSGRDACQRANNNQLDTRSTIQQGGLQIIVVNKCIILLQ